MVNRRSYPPFSSNAVLIQCVPSRQTRSAAWPLLFVPRLTTDFTRRSFSYAAPVIWYSLPTEVMLCDSEHSFKRHSCSITVIRRSMCSWTRLHAMRLISGALRSTPLSWLPVLSNIEPPALRRKAATDKLVEKIVKHDSWPIQPDILSPPLLRLTSRKPLWLDLQPVDIKSRWRHNWKSTQVVDSHLVCDPTIRQPGFDLPRQQWSLLNRFRTERVYCPPTQHIIGHFGDNFTNQVTQPTVP